MITVLFDRESGRPLYEQLYRFIRTEIESGRLRPGEKMPSKRRLAMHLKISPVTVESAYGQLTAEGYLRAEPRRGYYVQLMEDPLPPAAPAPTNLIPPAPAPRPRYAYEFKTRTVDTELFPFATWAKLAREVLAGNREELLNVTHPQGSPALRAQIAKYLYHFRGIRADAEQIVVGAGSEYLLGLLVQLTGQTRVYAVENPGYHKVDRILHRNGVKTVPVPVDEDGLSADALRRTDADIVHITPSHQFPTGVVMPVRRRAALLNWANEKAGRYILEDDYDSEFRFSGHPIPALQGLDQAGKVVYLNAFTKSLAPSLRIGYMVLPPALLERYRREFLFYSCTVPNFEQYTLSRFMASGGFERHLNRMRAAYRERRDLLAAAISGGPLSGRVELVGQDAGLHLLMRVHNGMDESRLVAAAKACGVRVYGLSEYCSPPVPDLPPSTVVIGYSNLRPADIPAAVRLLEQAWAL